MEGTVPHNSAIPQACVKDMWCTAPKKSTSGSGEPRYGILPGGALLLRAALGVFCKTSFSTAPLERLGVLIVGAWRSSMCGGYGFLADHDEGDAASPIALLPRSTGSGLPVVGLIMTLMSLLGVSFARNVVRRLLGKVLWMKPLPLLISRKNAVLLVSIKLVSSHCSKCYKRVPLRMLEEFALESGYPLYALNVALNMYSGNRRILVQGAVSEAYKPRVVSRLAVVG
eukprot:922081-Amphidinium_carterae.1